MSVADASGVTVAGAGVAVCVEDGNGIGVADPGVDVGVIVRVGVFVGVGGGVGEGVIVGAVVAVGIGVGGMAAAVGSMSNAASLERLTTSSRTNPV